MLQRRLQSIAAQVFADEVSPSIVVVDNESAPNNRAAIEKFAESCPLPVYYVHEPRAGIAVARNRALEKAVTLRADWIAFTDDDCEVNPDWLNWLIKAAKWYQADIVTGHRKFVYPDNAPTWLRRKELSRYEGQRVENAPTHNVLISRRLFSLGFDERLPYGEDNDFIQRALRLRFNETLAHGSDSEFSAEARAHGIEVVYSRKPVVWEHVPPERATLRYRVRISYRFAMSNASRDLRFGRRVRAVRKAVSAAAVEAPVSCIKLGVAFILRPFNRERYDKRISKYGTKLFGAIGKIVGLFGHFGNPYQKIDGY
jgi:glycosyltransferase involved in cell wall biosynthesis